MDIRRTYIIAICATLMAVVGLFLVQWCVCIPEFGPESPPAAQYPSSTCSHRDPNRMRRLVQQGPLHSTLSDVCAISLSPDASLAIAVCRDRTLQARRMPGGQLEHTYIVPGGGAVSQASHCESGERWVVVCADGAALMLKYSAGVVEWSSLTCDRMIVHACISGDGAFVIAATDSNELYTAIFPSRGNSTLRRIQTSLSGRVKQVCASYNGSHVAVQCRDEDLSDLIHVVAVSDPSKERCVRVRTYIDSESMCAAGRTGFFLLSSGWQIWQADFEQGTVGAIVVEGAEFAESKGEMVFVDKIMSASVDGAFVLCRGGVVDIACAVGLPMVSELGVELDVFAVAGAFARDTAKCIACLDERSFALFAFE